MKRDAYAQGNAKYRAEKAEQGSTDPSDTYIELSLEDLGVQQGQIVTWQEREKIADEWGLEKCPPGIGPALRVAYQDQPVGSWFSIYMEPITDSDGRPSVFGLNRRGDRLKLRSGWAGDRWDPRSRWVFRIRKLKT